MKPIECVIEIPKGSEYKYEIKDGQLFVDRPLNQPIPYNYGYVTDTLAEDGDALDIFIVTDTPIQAGAKCFVKIIGAFKCKDNNTIDDKLVGIVFKSNTPDYYINIYNFLSTYKMGFKVEEFTTDYENILKKAQEKFKKADK